MDELKVTKQNAMAAYLEAGKNGQKMLEALFGKKVFKGSVRDRIQNFDDVLDEVGVSTLEFISLTKNLPKRFVAETQLEFIALAYNEGKVPDWDDTDQRKYWGWFWMDSTRGFSFSVSDCGLSPSGVAARHYVETEEKATFMGETHIKIYDRYING